MSGPIQFNPNQSLQPIRNLPDKLGRPSSQLSAANQNIDFAGVLKKAKTLKFSNHAQKRMVARNIGVGPEKLTRISEAVKRAAKHGSRESLVLLDDLAFIVNVRDMMVVTAMNVKNNGDGVFTHIDSVVLAGSEIS